MQGSTLTGKGGKKEKKTHCLLKNGCLITENHPVMDAHDPQYASAKLFLQVETKTGRENVPLEPMKV